MSALTWPINVRWKRSTLPCACDLYAGDCRTAMLLPIAVAVAFSSAMRKSSLTDCMTVLLSTACVLPHSIRNCGRHVDRYCMLCVLFSICAAMHMLVSTSRAVKIVDVVCSPIAL